MDLNQLSTRQPEISRQHAKLIERVIDEIFSPFPYLTLSDDWNVVENSSRPSVKWANGERTEMIVRLPVRYKSTEGREKGYKLATIALEMTLSQEGRPISPFTRDFVLELIKVGSDVLKVIARNDDSAGTFNAAGIEEMTTLGIASFLEDRSELPTSLYPIIRHLSRLSTMTYENQRLAYAVVFTDGERTEARFPDDVLDNKRYLRLSDGVTTAIALNAEGYIQGLIPLPKPEEDRPNQRFSPRWLSPLAQVSADKENLAIALTRNGELHVVHSGYYIASRRAGRWVAWSHEENVQALVQMTSADLPGTRIIRGLYQAALDLSSKRSGGLLVWLDDLDRALNNLLPKADVITNSRLRSLGDRALDASLEDSILFDHSERSRLVELASLDGAVVLAPDGSLVAYGTVLNATEVPKRVLDQGARTKAAYAASQYGLALKVSSDGEITAYYGGRRKLRL